MEPLWLRDQVEFGHWEVPGVCGNQTCALCHRYGGHEHVCSAEGYSSSREVIAVSSGFLGCFRTYLVIVQGSDESVGSFPLVGLHARVEFCHVNRAHAQLVAFCEQ